MARRLPRISVLKLAEYMGASTLRRRQIVQDQFDPPGQIVPRYRRVRSAVAAYLAKGARDTGILIATIHKLERQQADTEWAESDRVNSIAALEHLVALVDQLKLGDRIFVRGMRSDSIRLSGVQVSVVPSVVLLQEGRGEAIGCIKLVLSKTRPISETEGRTAATLLRYFVDTRGEGDEKAVPRLCQVVDVFNEHVFRAPRSFKRTMREAEAACEEIALVWPGQVATTIPHRRPTTGGPPPVWVN